MLFYIRFFFEKRGFLVLFVNPFERIIKKMSSLRCFLCRACALLDFEAKREETE
jgi:hypothetical protein